MDAVYASVQERKAAVSHTVMRRRIARLRVSAAIEDTHSAPSAICRLAPLSPQRLGHRLPGGCQGMRLHASPLLSTGSPGCSTCWHQLRMVLVRAHLSACC